MDQQVRDFMARVVPWPTNGSGHVGLHWHLPGGPFRDCYVSSVDDFLASVERVADKSQNIYFCLSQLRAKKRIKDNATYLKSIWLDVDVKKPPKGYASLKEALESVRGFTARYSIPPPSAVVYSGGGIHVYWFSNRPLTVTEWRPYAAGLKAAAQAYGLRCDAGVTADAARVLRVPGTRNFKTNPPREVRVAGLREDEYDFSAALSAVLVPAETDSRGALSPFTPVRPLSKISIPARFAGRKDVIVVKAGDLPPARLVSPLPVLQKCGFLRTAFKTGGEDYAEPLWNLTTLCATFMEEGNKFAHKFGEKHPGYTPESTNERWERKLREKEEKNIGWPSCRAIRDDGCTDCATCPHFAKSKSPLHLGLPKKAVNRPEKTPPVAVAAVQFRDRYRDGNPKPSLANAVTAISALGIQVRYDLFHQRINVTYKGQSKTIREGLLTDDTVSAARSLINNTYGIDCGDGNTFAAIKEIAMHNAYDPVLDMLRDCQSKWDGKQRLDSWVIDYLGCKDTPLNRAIGRKALLGACRRARQPGCKFDSITVLEGVEGTNKSTAIRILAGDEDFSDQSIIGASDKEVQEQLDGVWMHENADLAGMKRADVEQVKAFASRQVDRARPAYGRVREDRPRRSIEWGTTNNNEYLLSQSGNRRFWPLETGKIDIAALKREREHMVEEGE